MEKEKPKIQNATVKKPSIAKELSDYAMKEIIVPKSTEIIYDMLSSVVGMIGDTATKVIERKLYPNGAPKRGNNKPTYGVYTYNTNRYSYVNYAKQSDKPSNQLSMRSGHDINYIWVDEEKEAKEIVGSLKEDIDNYGKAKVATLYEMVGIPTTFADFKFGWSQDSLPQIGYYKETTGENRGKWFIDLPKPVSIENV